MLFISILLYFLFSFFIFISFNDRIDFGKLIQCFFICTFTSNILIFSCLNIFNAIDQTWAYLLLEFVLCVPLSIWMIVSKKITFKRILSTFRLSRLSLNRTDKFFIALIALILISFFIVGLTTPPNNLDSLDPTHLSKLFYWFQQGNLGNSSSGVVLNILDPIGVHVQGLWLFLLGHSESLFFLVQWFSLVLAVISIYKISRLLQYSKTASIICAMVCLSFPVVLLQTYSFQGDLTVASLILVSISFGFSYLTRNQKFDLVGTFLAFLLALTSKKAAIIALPLIILFIFILLLRKIKQKKIIPWIVVISSVIIVVTGLFAIISIVKNNKTIAGISLLADNYSSFDQITEKIKYNIPRYLYQFIGFDGLPRVMQISFNSTKADIFRNILLPVNLDLEKEVFLQPGYSGGEKFIYEFPISLHEDSSWFGPLGFLLIPIALLLSLFSSDKKRRIYACAGVLFFFFYSFIVLLQRPGWDPFQGRYFILAVLPIIPNIAILIPKKRKLQWIVMMLVIPVSLFLSFNTFFTNDSKPISTARSMWSFQEKVISRFPESTVVKFLVTNNVYNQTATHALDKKSIYSVPYWEQVYFSGSTQLQNIQFIESVIPENEAIYLDIYCNSLEYGLFGKNKTRSVYRVNGIYEVQSGYFLTNSSAKIETGENIRVLGKNEDFQIIFVDSP